MCTRIGIEMAAYEMESSVRGYHVYKDLWDASSGEDILMMKIDMLCMSVVKDDTFVGHIPRKIPGSLFSVFSKGWCYNLYAYMEKEIFFTPAVEYIRYNFQHKIVLYLNIISCI